MGVFTDRTGEERYNNAGSLMRIIKYRNNKDIDILFVEHDYIKQHINYNKFVNGTISSPYDTTLYNLGFIGEGNYTHNSHGKIYDTWRNMFYRCYDNNFHHREPSYINCEVDEEWYNFQNFAQWYEDNYYEMPEEKLDLDKDFLYEGNKIYSPETCCFLPHSINMLIVKSNTTKGDCPVGINFYKNKYVVNISINNKNKYLGRYSTIEEALSVYRENKTNYINSKLEEYKDYIPIFLYERLITI